MLQILTQSERKEPGVEYFSHSHPGALVFLVHVVILSPYQQFPIATATSRDPQWCVMLDAFLIQNYHHRTETWNGKKGLVIRKQHNNSFNLTPSYCERTCSVLPESCSTHCLTGLSLSGLLCPNEIWTLIVLFLCVFSLSTGDLPRFDVVSEKARPNTPQLERKAHL